MQALISFFSSKDFIPHGYCLSWSPLLLWLHVISDLLITLAYYSIPVMLVYFIRRRRDFPYPWLVTLFAAFIVACGTTHLLSAITIWIPLYWLDGVMKALTAVISLATAALMLWIIPRLLFLPSAAQLQAEIQQRKAAENELRESEQKLATVLDSVEAFIYIKDCNYQYQYANQALRQRLGRSLEDITGKTDEAFFNEATTAKLRENDRRVIERGERTATEAIYSNKNDAIAHAYFTVNQPLQHEDGRIYGLCGIATDISERRRMEEKLRDSEAFTNSILDSLTSHIVVLDEHGIILAVNSAWRRFARENSLPECNRDMLGLSYLDACNSVINRHYNNEADAAHAGIAAVLAGQLGSFELEYPCHSPDQQRWFHMKVSPLRGWRRGVVVNHENITGRKQAERLLIKLKAMIDVSLEGFWIVDLTGNVLQVNDAYARISGYSREELTNMNLGQLEAMEDFEQINAHIAKIVEQGCDQFETRHRRKDGRIIDIEMSVAFLPEFQHICGFCRDISARRAMEEELKASEAKFRSIINASPVPMLLNDEQMNITFVNPAFVQTFGYTRDDIPTVPKWWLKAYPDRDYRLLMKSTWQERLEKARQEHTSFLPFEVVIHCKNNDIKTVVANTATIDQCTPNEYVVILYDISQRKQIEAKLNAIFDASVEGIITINKEDIIVSSNTAVETIFGYKPKELIGRGIGELMPSSASCSLSPAIKCIGQIEEIEGIHKNGFMVPLDLSVAEFSIENEFYYTYIVRDVSLRKCREELDKMHLDELAHVTRLGLMGEMASGIAHEVNQPLSAISSYTQVCLNLINAETLDLPKLAEILHKTQQQSLRAGRIIHRMREFVKSHARRCSSADINALLHDAAGLCVAELKQNNIKLTFNLENHLPMFYVDHIQIEQVIINLIRNSIDALISLGETDSRDITIQSRLLPDKGLQVRVKDNGQGLNDEQKQKIWTPFFTTKTNGMGMGLSISRSIIEAHEGTLSFESQSGKGTTFYFTLPLPAKPDQS
jgi:PAS domain S-box-containing protein